MLVCARERVCVSVCVDVDVSVDVHSRLCDGAWVRARACMRARVSEVICSLVTSEEGRRETP